VGGGCQVRDFGYTDERQVSQKTGLMVSSLFLTHLHVFLSSSSSLWRVDAHWPPQSPAHTFATHSNEALMTIMCMRPSLPPGLLLLPRHAPDRLHLGKVL
jgi:hypothetical protein